MSKAPTGIKKGPARKPSHLKSMENRKFKGLPDDEPQPDALEPEMPDWLDEGGKKIWKKLLPILLGSRLITAADGTTYGLFCQAYSDLVKVEEAKQGLPMFKMNTDDEGNITSTTVYQHVYLARDLRTQVLKYAIQFGMSPASRSGLSIESLPTKDPYDEWKKRKAASAKKKLS